MDSRKQSNGMATFMEHWGWMLAALVALLSTQIFGLLTRLPWDVSMWWYTFALATASCGIALIFYAKLSVYRQRRFFTFGSAALPAERRIFYRIGYGCILTTIAFLVCLLAAR